jgi:hypothetical protein
MQILLKLCLANIEQASNDFPQEKKKKKTFKQETSFKPWHDIHKNNA